MLNHYYTEGPTCISFSGGRTSGLMLFKTVAAHGGTLPDYVHVVFADTGKEHPGTYEFVAGCAERLDLVINTVKMDHEGHETAFDALIAKKKYLPNPAQRFCTTEMKIEPMRKFMKDKGYSHWTNFVGLRYDEPDRLKRKMTECDPDFESYPPLALDRVTKRQVLLWWKSRNDGFDLTIPAGFGNCQGCFMKDKNTLISIEQQAPGTLQWYADKEKQIGGTFRPPHRRDPYEKLIRFAEGQGQLFKTSDRSVGCMCTD